MGSRPGGAISLFRDALCQLREEARAGGDGAALTGLLREAFSCRNEFDATLTALIGELDRLERERPDGEGERSVPGWLQREVHLTGQAAHSQVRLARQLSGLPLAAAAYERGEIGFQHAMTVARTVEQVEHGGAEQGDVRGAEMLMVEEGRARRTASKRMRKALAVRDRGCTTPGCDRPPSWTQAHHEQPWSEGGTTDLPNLTSQCLLDHRDADAGYRTVRLPDGRLARVRPDDEQFGPAIHDQGGRGP